MTKTLKLTTAQELHKLCKEKGVEMPRSEKFWVRMNPEKTSGASCKWGLSTDNSLKDLDFWDFINNYDCCELFKWLPNGIEVFKVGNKYTAKIADDIPLVQNEKTPQEALAKLIIFLVSNDLMK